MLKLKSLREERKISQQKLALDLNVSQASISKYEKGIAEPDIPMLCAMANYFHVSVDYLVGQTEQRCSFTESPLTEKELLFLSNFKELAPYQKEKVEMYILGLLDR